MPYTSKVNGLDIPISSDMGRAASFFKTEHSATVIDNGLANVNLQDPAQVASEVKRLEAQVAALKKQGEKKTTSKKAEAVKAEAEAEKADDLA